MSITMKTKTFAFVNFDMNNVQIYYGDTIRVPDPKLNDLWDHEFVGTAVNSKQNGDITVQDEDGNCFDIESNIVEKMS